MKALFGICFLSVAGYGGFQASKHMSEEQWLRLLRIEPKTIVETRVEVREKHKAKFEEALAVRLKRSPLPEVIVRGVLRKEGRQYPKRMSYIKYEDSHRTFALTKSKNPEEVRAWASSHCPFQVMAVHASEAGLEWSDLYDPEVCVELGMKKLESCWQQTARFETLDRVDYLGRCYNGGNIDTKNSDAIAYGRFLREWVGVAAIEMQLDGKK